MNKEIVFEGKKIFYRMYGTGKSVMLVHGFGETGDVWKNQASLNPSKGGTLANTQSQLIENTLFKNIRFIIPDLPGSGSSEMINDMSMEGMAEAIKAIADKETTNPFALIGHSMGGYIALAFAAKYPQVIKKLCLFHSSAYADSEEKKETRKKGIAFIEEHGAFEFLKNTTPNLFSPITKSENPSLIDDFIQSLNNFSGQALVSYYETMMNRPDRTSVLKNATFPVQFIAGKDDVAIPLDDVLKLCHLPEKSYIDVLKKSGHMGMLEEPEKCNSILENFLK